MRLVSGVGACCVHVPFTACRHDNRIACAVLCNSATFSNPTMTMLCRQAQINSIISLYITLYNNFIKKIKNQRINWCCGWINYIIAHAGIYLYIYIERVYIYYYAFVLLHIINPTYPEIDKTSCRHPAVVRIIFEYNYFELFGSNEMLRRRRIYGLLLYICYKGELDVECQFVEY